MSHLLCFLLNDVMGINLPHLGTQNTQGPIDWHKHVHSYSVLHWITSRHINFLYWGPQFISFSKTTLCRCHISAKTNAFLWNTKNTNNNNINKQNINNIQWEKDIFRKDWITLVGDSSFLESPYFTNLPVLPFLWENSEPPPPPPPPPCLFGKILKT